MRITEKAAISDCIEYKGDTGEVKNFCSSFKEDFEARFYFDEEFNSLFIITPNADVSLSKGDFIIRNSFGEYFPLDAKSFKEFYVPHLEKPEKGNN